MSSKKPKFHDGYVLSVPLEDKLIHFYRDSPYNKVVVRPRVYGVEVFKVDEEKVVAYEDMCETYRKNFMEMGWLRLHTPLYMHEEHRGTDFLYVPPSERARIAGMLNGKPLITMYNIDGSMVYCPVEAETKGALTALHKELPPGYRVIVRGFEELAAFIPIYTYEKGFSLEELIGSGEMVNLSEIREQNRERLERGVISEEEVEKQVQAIQESKFYFIFGFEIEGMFIQREKTWLGKIFG